MIVFVRFRVLVLAFVLGGLAVLWLTHALATTSSTSAVHHVRAGSAPLELRAGAGADQPAIASLAAGTSIAVQCWATGSPVGASPVGASPTTSLLWVRGTAGIDGGGGSATGWVPATALDLDGPTLADPSHHGLSEC